MYKLKDYKEALEWIEQTMALPNLKNDPELLSHYGDILYKMRNGKAVEQWQKALQKGGDKTTLESKIKNKKIN